MCKFIWNVFMNIVYVYVLIWMKCCYKFILKLKFKKKKFLLGYLKLKVSESFG